MHMGWWIVLGVAVLITLLLLSPVIVYVDFQNMLLTADVRLMGARIPVFSSDEFFGKKKKKKPSYVDKLVATSKKRVSELASLIQEDSSLSLVTFLRDAFLVIWELIGRVLRGVVVRRFDLTVHIGSGDAADTAITYGEVCSVLYPFVTALESNLRIKRRCWDVRPDFLSQQSLVEAHIRATLPLARAIFIVVWFLVRYTIVLTEELDEPTYQVRPRKSYK
jgi:hypothetical protein